MGQRRARSRGRPKRRSSVTVTLTEQVRAIVAAVDDPEYPGVSIADLGILESVRVDPEESTVTVDLVPTFLGCPALEVIAHDVERAASTVPGVKSVLVNFIADPLWSIERITDRGRELLAGEYTVAVPPKLGEPSCPVCSAPSIEIRSPFGATACRAIGYCKSCLNPLEVMRR